MTKYGARLRLLQKHLGLEFGSPLRWSRVLFGMNGLDGQYYREEAKRCQEAAAKARDPATKEYWLKSERCWIKLANQAELMSPLDAVPKVPTQAPQKKPRNADAQPRSRYRSVGAWRAGTNRP